MTLDEIGEKLTKELDKYEVSEERQSVFGELAYTAYEAGLTEIKHHGGEEDTILMKLVLLSAKYKSREDIPDDIRV